MQKLWDICDGVDEVDHIHEDTANPYYTRAQISEAGHCMINSINHYLSDNCFLLYNEEM